MKTSLPLSLLVIGPRGSGKSTVAYRLTEPVDRLLVCDTFHEPLWRENLLVAERLEDVVDLVGRPKFRVCYSPLEAEDTVYLAGAALVARDCVVVVEEVSQIIGIEAPPAVRREWKRFVRLARHRGCRLVATTQRPADSDKLLVAEADLLIGRLQEPNDRRYLRDLGRLDRETVDSLLELEPWQWYSTSQGIVVSFDR